MSRSSQEAEAKRHAFVRTAGKTVCRKCRLTGEMINGEKDLVRKWWMEPTPENYIITKLSVTPVCCGKPLKIKPRPEPKPRKPKPEKMKMLTIHFPESMLALIRSIAKEDKTSAGDIVRNALSAAIAARERSR